MGVCVPGDARKTPSATAAHANAAPAHRSTPGEKALEPDVTAAEASRREEMFFHTPLRGRISASSSIDLSWRSKFLSLSCIINTFL